MVEGAPKAFVCGHPIGHSRSPLIHNYWLSRHALRGEYLAVDVSARDFPDFIRSLRENGFVGGNVTIPHKETAFALADIRDEAAELIGAVNTLWLDDGILRATNTDWLGFAGNLDEHAAGWDKGRIAVLLGAGGAARAVVHALVRRGFREIRIVNRTKERADELARRFGGGASARGWPELPDLLRDCDLLVNTTSLGMSGDDTPAPDLSPLPRHSLVTDIVYVPLETPLLAAARARGLATVDGLGMLLHQAVPGFEHWFGVRPSVTSELRDLVVADMERHS